MSTRIGPGGVSSSSMGTSSASATNRALMPPPSTSGSAVKARQLSHLLSQLEQLSANLADTENLVRMTSVQADSMRVLGSWHGGMFMAASKVLGEESIKDHGEKK